MALRNPTPPATMCDAQGRPYFLWDVDMTLTQFRDGLAHGNNAERAYLLGKLMRQAKPDDVFEFVTLADVAALWPEAQRYLGKRRDFWTWFLHEWDAI